MRILKKDKRLLKRVVIFIWILTLIILEGSSYGERGIIKYCSDFKIFDMQWSYGVNSVYESLKMLPKEGISHYKIYLLVDTVMTVAFAGVQYLLAHYICKKAAVRKILVLLLVVRMCCDLIENTCIMIVMCLLPLKCIKIVMFSNIVTKIKFIALIGFFICFTVLCVKNLSEKLRNRNLK